LALRIKRLALAQTLFEDERALVGTNPLVAGTGKRRQTPAWPVTAADLVGVRRRDQLLEISSGVVQVHLIHIAVALAAITTDHDARGALRRLGTLTF
jgi:hypothetical protein